MFVRLLVLFNFVTLSKRCSGTIVPEHPLTMRIALVALIHAYEYREPHPQLYKIGLLLGPCVNKSFDCCVMEFGSPAYGRLKKELVSYSHQLTDHLLLADPDEILANVDLVDETGADIDSAERRRADDEVYVDESCESIRNGHDVHYRLEENGKVTKLHDSTRCQGMRKAHRPFSIKPPCQDNNATVNATQSCQDKEGNESPNCVQVAFTQTAVIVECGDDQDCGTYLEIHRPNGSPYDDEDVILNEKKLKDPVTSGYTTTTISLNYGVNSSRILCNYEEDQFRVGSLVYITSKSPSCCCPPLYNNDKQTGAFSCPQNAYDATAGPFARSVNRSLAHLLAFNTSVDNYPYCPKLPEDQDTFQCSGNASFFGSPRVYNHPCPAVTPGVTDVNASLTTYSSKYLVGSYEAQCFFFDSCAGNPLRSGDYADGALEGTESTGCSSNCRDFDCDSYFSFHGLIGKVTCVPTDDEPCINPADPKFDDDATYFLVSFNDHRTSYPFRDTDLVLHQPRANYELWWVQRTKGSSIVQKRKPFRVNAPTCTFDSVHDRYFPYTILLPDGSHLDTAY